MSRKCFFGLVIIFMLQMAANFFTPIWAAYTHSLGGTVRSAGISIAIFSWGTAFFSVVIPIVNHKNSISEKCLLMMGIFLSLLVVIGYFFIHQIYYFYVAQFILSFSAGMQIPSFYVLYEKYITEKNRGFAWGVLESVFYVSLGLASLVAAFLFEHFGIQAVFSCMLVLIVIAQITAFFFV
ncbi:MAG: MFS transporter [Coxiellaceae bacterium]|nr:MFS transporter [Coxiellaceae bacterium]